MWVSGELRRKTANDRLASLTRGLPEWMAIAGLTILIIGAGSFVAGLLVLGLVSILVVWLLLKRYRYRRQEWLRRYTEQVRDTERRRLVGELHDGVVQDLAGINYALERLRLGGVPADRRGEVIADSATRLRRSIGMLRTLLVDSYPPDIAGNGLGHALAGLAEGLERSGIEVRLEVTRAERLPPAVSALIFRAAQEAVRNVATHSGAREVVITAERSDGQATLVVADDGQGFDEARIPEWPRAGHFGLRTTSDLMTACGGVLRVRAAPGQGTTVSVEVPVG